MKDMILLLLLLIAIVLISDGRPAILQIALGAALGWLVAGSLFRRDIRKGRIK
jgi:hypothetical protein